MKKESWHAKIWIKHHPFDRKHIYDDDIFEGTGKATGKFLRYEPVLPEDSCDYFGWWIGFILKKIFNCIAILLGCVLALFLIWIYGSCWYKLITGETPFLLQTKDGRPAPEVSMWIMWGVVNIIILAGIYQFIHDKTGFSFSFIKHAAGKMKRKPFCFKINWK